jgi:hypothetical protein
MCSLEEIVQLNNVLVPRRDSLQYGNLIPDLDVSFFDPNGVFVKDSPAHHVLSALVDQCQLLHHSDGRDIPLGTSC